MADKKKLAAGVGIVAAATGVILLATAAKAAPLIPDIRLENLIIEATYAGAPAWVAVTAKNYGTGTGSRTVTCEVPLLGYNVSHTVTLAPGQSKRISWMPYPAEEGTYEVFVDGLTGSFIVIEVLVSVGIGIYDETVPEYVPGTLFVDETPYSSYYYEIVSVQLNITHVFNLTVPPGYHFLRWEIFDWATGDLILQKTTRQFSLMVDRALFMQAIVRPL